MNPFRAVGRDHSALTSVRSRKRSTNASNRASLVKELQLRCCDCVTDPADEVSLDMREDKLRERNKDEPERWQATRDR